MNGSTLTWTITRALHRLAPRLHDWVDRPFRSVAPGPREVHGMRGVCRDCGATRWIEES